MLKAHIVSKNYDTRSVLTDISFEVKTGEIIAIVGESGSGKSTLLKILACQLDPDSGQVLLEDKVISPPKVQRLLSLHPDIKLVAQDFQLKPDFKIRENIDYALRTYTPEYRNSRVQELLVLCGISHIANQKAKNVSGGEKQRTAIAYAIADEPKVLLMDEPFSHLDSLNRQILKEKILGIIKKEEIAGVFVSHDLMEALTVADKILLIKNGHMIQYDTPLNFLQNPSDSYVSQFVAAALKPFEEFEELFRHQRKYTS
jgi:ABC-type proline/glycine betaine transport system ATPase subunit